MTERRATAAAAAGARRSARTPRSHDARCRCIAFEINLSAYATLLLTLSSFGSAFGTLGLRQAQLETCADKEENSQSGKSAMHGPHDDVERC